MASFSAFSSGRTSAGARVLGRVGSGCRPPWEGGIVRMGGGIVRMDYTAPGVVQPAALLMARLIPNQGAQMRNTDSFLRTATAIGLSDRVASQASLGNLVLGVGSTSIGADAVLAQAEAAAGSATGSSVLGNLTLNGVPVDVSGDPNQTISIPGGRLVINEQTPTAGGIVVNALHLVVYGIADVVLGSATAAIQ